MSYSMIPWHRISAIENDHYRTADVGSDVVRMLVMDTEVNWKTAVSFYETLVKARRNVYEWKEPQVNSATKKLFGALTQYVREAERDQPEEQRGATARTIMSRVTQQLLQIRKHTNSAWEAADELARLIEAAHKPVDTKLSAAGAPTF